MAVQGEPTAAPVPLTEFAQLWELSGLLVGVIVFLTLIGVDTCKALKKRAYWIPGDALVLSALTIQLLNLLNGQSTLVDQILANTQPSKEDAIKNYLFMIHISRVMLCVLVAYLLPGMARPELHDSWGNVAAMALSILMHITSELFTVHERLYRRFTEVSFIISGVIISLSLVWLTALLSSAIIASKSIRDITRQKIPKILAHQSNDIEYSWSTIKNRLLKSWIIARACYPEYIIARSVLATSAALAVTICILSSFIGWLVDGPAVIVFHTAGTWLKFFTTILEVVFILTGWAIIGWRWLTSVAYYGRWPQMKDNKTWGSYFSVEDFWTRHILELQEAVHEKSQNRRVDERVSKMISTAGMERYLRPGIFLLLRCLFWLQFCVVIFSKGCWLLSDFICLKKIAETLLPKFFLKHNEKVGEESLRSREILDQDVHILWETPSSVFKANWESIKQAEELLQEGYTDGKHCQTLIEFLKKYYTSPGCVDISSCLGFETGFKFLWRQDPGPDLDVEKHFIFASKRSWKLTAVSLVYIIVRLSPERAGRQASEAYYEACELMDLVDESDPETDSLVSKAADSLFKTLKEVQSAEQTLESIFSATITLQEAAAKIDELANESELKATVIGDGQDSLDWKKAAAGNALYKLCKSIDYGSGDFQELINELQGALAGVIGGCIGKVRAALVDNCMKWAQDLQERKLLTAIYTAGKSEGLMAALEWDD